MTGQDKAHQLAALHKIDANAAQFCIQNASCIAPIWAICSECH